MFMHAEQNDTGLAAGALRPANTISYDVEHFDFWRIITGL